MTRVLQIPGAHPYVDRCVADRRDLAAVSVAGQPNPALDVRWLQAHHHEFDVVHLHFGFEHLGVAQLRAWVEGLAQHDLPLVYTAHDLRNPHQLSPQPHNDLLEVLIPSAAVVLTLTPAAAQEIHRRWGRTAQVLAHPCVFDPDDRPDRPPSRRLVGIHLKDLRTNVVDPDRVVGAVAKGAGDAGGRLQVDLHPAVASHPGLCGTRELARDGDLDLRVHERYDDGSLAEYLAALDVFVLPYQFGTHSGWIEACRDLGTRIVVPSCGSYRQQWDQTVVYGNDETSGLDEGSLADAVRDALLAGPLRPAPAAFRREQLARIQAAQAEIYFSLARVPRAVS